MSDDILAAMEKLPTLEGYTKKDRYNDFRKLFGGSKEGKRALRYILERGGVFNEPALKSPIDPLMLAAHRGKRQMALEIFAFYNNEPPEQPTKATRKQVQKR